MSDGKHDAGNLFVTAKGTGDRLAAKGPLAFEADPDPDLLSPAIVVDSDKTYQTIEGFGGALTDSSAEVWAKLPAECQQEVMTACFDRENGLAYSLCRTNIHSCDFSSASYDYHGDPADAELTKFSIDHDRRYRLPFIKAAATAAPTPLRILASPWSPPAYMKTNGEMLHGGKLRPEFAAAWARYLAKFVEAYEAEGVNIWAMTVQNEPLAVQTWESCIFTANEERDFIKNHLGPQLAGDGLSRVKLLAWDHNRDVLYARAKAIFDDPEASRYVWGTAFHWYNGDHFDQVRQVAEAWPDKSLVFTEGCVERFDARRINEWQWGERYGTSMLIDLSNGTSAWIDWNVLLDERGGPNHVGNFCFAPMHADTTTGQLTYMSSYYYIGHFSRFIRPGARRVAATSGDDRLRTVAFRNSDGMVAVVVLNVTDDDVDFSFWIDGSAAESSSPGHSIITLVR